MALQMPTTQRDQGLAVGAFLGIAAIVVYYMYVWTPKAEVLTQKQARIDTLTAQNEIARREIAKGTATKLKEEAEQYGRMLTLMRTLVPVANDLPLMIDQVSTAARQTGLELGNITAPVIINGDIFDTYKYKMSVTGPYHRLARFFTNVSSLPRIFVPTNVSLTETVAGSKTGRLDPNELQLNATFELQTYVAKAGR